MTRIQLFTKNVKRNILLDKNQEEEYYFDMEKKKKTNKDTQKFKDKYFEYYDDVKSHTHKIYDW